MTHAKRIHNLYQQAHQIYRLQQLAQESRIHANNFPELFHKVKFDLHYRAIDEHLRAIIEALKEEGMFNTWPSPYKLGVGTAQTYDDLATPNPSRLWFTIAGGGITELMYPAIDEVATKCLSFLVTDDSSFVHNIAEDCVSSVRLIDRRALAYEIVSNDLLGRYRVVQEIITDPIRNCLLIRARFEALQGDSSRYRVYLHWVPLLGDKAWLHQIGRVDSRKFVALASNQYHIAVLKTEPRWINCMVGAPGKDSIVASLHQKFAINTSNDVPRNGSLEFVLELQWADAITVSLDFQPLIAFVDGPFAATPPDIVDTSPSKWDDPEALKLSDVFSIARDSYIGGWNNYCNRLDDLRGEATDFYYLSAMVLKAHMDKTNLGAVVASLSMPWGPARLDSVESQGYRQVWARDLYHTAVSFLILGDRIAAEQILYFMDLKLQQSDGSFPQTANARGDPNWTGLQLDQVAAPILLAWWLGAIDKYQSMVRPAAEFLKEHGPMTPFERWEENSGYSPASISAQIAALICAADLADRAGDTQKASSFKETADMWHHNIDKWCFTNYGLLPGRRYYLRISPSGDTNVDEPIRITNGGGWFDQRLIVDPSFLELVRLGLKRADNPRIVASLKVVDSVIRRATMKGISWYRYNHDGYGETEKGMNAPGRGHLWPLLTGERGVYEVARGNLASARDSLSSLERMANSGGLIPEQIWEGSGEPTGSATPLVWAHAEYILLLKSIMINEVSDRPSVVWKRYAAVE